MELCKAYLEKLKRRNIKDDLITKQNQYAIYTKGSINSRSYSYVKEERKKPEKPETSRIRYTMQYSNESKEEYLHRKSVENWRAAFLYSCIFLICLNLSIVLIDRIYNIRFSFPYGFLGLIPLIITYYMKKRKNKKYINNKKINKKL